LIVEAGLAHHETAFAQDTQQLPPIIVRGPGPQVVRHQPDGHSGATSSENALPNGDPVPQLTTAGPVSGYRALTAVSATKTDTAIERIPQTIQVIPRSVIDDQTARTQSEALRNAAGVTGVPDVFLHGLNYKVRGFDADRYVDGLPNYIDPGDYSSVVNTERIEVVKGPGGLFFQSGVGITGGVINTISKVPIWMPFLQAGVIAGKHGSAPWFDINQPLNADAWFRMTGEFEQASSHIDVTERKRYSFNPTLAFGNTGATSLIVQGRVSRREQQVYVGLPGSGTLDRSLFTLRRDLFVGPSDIPKGVSENYGVTARFDHQFNDGWSFNAAARYSMTRQDDISQTFLPLMPNFGSSFFMFNSHSPWEAREISVSPNLVGKFSIGDTRSTLLLGADYNRVADNVSIWSSLAGMTDFANPYPRFPAYVDPVGRGTLAFDADNVSVNSGLTAQLQTTVRDRLHILAGLRWAYVDFLGSKPFAAARYHVEQGKLLPRFGVGYDIFPGVTPFVGYSEGLRTVRFFGGPGVPKPEEAEQIEGGVKLVLPTGFAATLAVFDIKRRNVVTADPLTPFLAVQTGEQRSRGFDVNATWQPLRGLSVLASYAYVDAEITEDAVFSIGNRLQRVPANSGRLWANYKIQEGWLRNVVVGAGLYAASRQAVDLKNTFFTPAFVTFDARVGYEGDHWSVGIVGKNLANRRYFVPYPYAQGRIAPEEPLSVFAVVSVKH
jgi:iron complex outermembrane receptor protein